MFSIVSDHVILVDVIVNVKHDGGIMQYETSIMVEESTWGESSQMIRLGDFSLNDVDSINLQWKFLSNHYNRTVIIDRNDSQQNLKNIKDFILGIIENRHICLWGITEQKSMIIPMIEESDKNLDSDTKSVSDMRQYNYRCVLLNGYISFLNGTPELMEYEEIKVKLFDGTYDKTNYGSICQYHLGAIPKVLMIRWKEVRNIYSSVCIWFYKEVSYNVFEHFYGKHPDTKTDLIVNINTVDKQLSISLFRPKLKSPIPIKDSGYEFIVFKNGLEQFRSDNYNQPCGAWIW